MIYFLIQCGSYCYDRIFFILLLALLNVGLSFPAYAACPLGSTLTTDRRIQQSLSSQNLALSAGSLSASVDLGSAFANANLNLTDPNSLTQTIAIGPNPRYWRLRMPKNFPITSKELTVTYEIRGYNGQRNVISSPNNTNSVVGATIQSSSIKTRRKGKRIRFFGSVILALNLRTALISGPHNGTLTVTIDCF